MATYKHKPRAFRYKGIFEYTKALEEYIKDLQEALQHEGYYEDGEWKE